MIEPQCHQTGHRLGRAAGARQPEVDALDQAIDAIDRQFECCRALAAILQHLREPLGQQVARLLDGSSGQDRLGKALLDNGRRDGLPRADRFRVDAAGPIELQDQGRAEAGGERTAWPADQIADAFEADPA